MDVFALIYVPTDTTAAMAMSARRVCGVPLAVRATMTAFLAGINRCTLLVASSDRQRIEKFFRRYRDDRLPQISLIEYDEPYGVTPRVIDECIKSIEGASDSSCLLINSNLLMGSAQLKNMIQILPDKDQLLIAKQGMTELPIFLTSRDQIQKLSTFTSAKPKSIESCIAHLREISKSCEMRMEAPHQLTFLVRGPMDRHVAEKFLAESIRHSTAAPIARIINKRISLPISMLLSRMWISPHAITAANIFVGLVCGVFLAGGTYYDMLIGALLFKLASIADGCDGEVAKLTFRSSKFGQYIDSISDNLTLASFFIGLSIGSYRSSGSIIPLIAGGWTLLAAGGSILVIASYLKNNTDSASLATFDTHYLSKLHRGRSLLLGLISHLKHFVKKDAYAMMSLLFAIPGWLPIWLYFCAFGATLSLVILIILQRRQLKVQ